MCFLAANIGAGVGVDLMLKANAESVANLPTLKYFGLISSVHDMWTAGVYPLAIVIAFFSGFWPYIKLLAMLVAWLSPQKLLTVNCRRKVLDMLDALGKWSLVDTFVMVMFMVAFKFKLSTDADLPSRLPDLSKIFEESSTNGAFQIYVEPLL